MISAYSMLKQQLLHAGEVHNHSGTVHLFSHNENPADHPHIRDRTDLV
jgi:hypothetical protein